MTQNGTYELTAGVGNTGSKASAVTAGAVGSTGLKPTHPEKQKFGWSVQLSYPVIVISWIHVCTVVLL